MKPAGLTFQHKQPVTVDGVSTGRITAVIGTEEVGHLTWQTRIKRPSVVDVGFVGVRERFKRQGIGTALMAELKRLFPGRKFTTDSLSQEGRPFWKSLGLSAADLLDTAANRSVTARTLDRAARILEAGAAGTISPITSQDIPAVLDVLSQAFAGIVDARTVQSIVNDLADWTMSRKLVVDDKIVGAYVLGSQSVLDFADNALEDLEPYRGKRAVHGVALGLLPEYRGSRLGAKLRDVPRSMPADYVWGMQYKVLGNISHWTRFGRRVVADEGDYVITLMDL